MRYGSSVSQVNKDCSRYSYEPWAHKHQHLNGCSRLEVYHGDTWSPDHCGTSRHRAVPDKRSTAEHWK
jgi:hypothetical protein